MSVQARPVCRLPRAALRLAVIGFCTLVLEGCVSGAHFNDMRRKIDELGIPESYERGGEHTQGSVPVLFGDLLSITRGYHSPNDLRATCAELQEVLAAREPEWIYRDNKCTANFRMRPGLRAATAVFYNTSVTALRPRDGDGTVVLVTLSE